MTEDRTPCIRVASLGTKASGKTGSGKKFHNKVISGADFAAQPYYVAIITPVIHYCMGGLEIDENSVVLGSD